MANLNELKLFISRRTKDQPIAKRIQDELTAACSDEERLKVFQSESIPSGAPWPEKLDQLLIDANCLMVIYRGEPMHWLAFETARFERDRERERVIAIHPPDYRPPWLESRQCVEASKGPLTNLFNEIIRDGSPKDNDGIGRFVALDPRYSPSKIEVLVDELIDLFGKQVRRPYGLAIRLTFDENDDLESTRTGCRWIGDNTEVSPIGQGGSLSLFDRGGNPTCTWEELTRHHRQRDLIEALTGVEPSPLAEPERWDALPDDQRADQLELWHRSFVTSWIYEIDAAVRSVRDGTNLNHPRRTLRAKSDGELYLPAVISATLTEGATGFLEAIEVALIRQPRPTSSAGPRFRILDLLERLRDEVIKPGSRIRGPDDRDRLEEVRRALSTIVSEVRSEELLDGAKFERAFEKPEQVIERVDELTDAYDTFERAMGDDDTARAIDELSRLEDAVYQVWRDVVDEYGRIIKGGLDKLVHSGPSEPETHHGG